jgi:hypothetical protein
MPQLSVSEAARRIGANPKDISDLFYRRELRDDSCPIVAGRRLIPDDYLDVIRLALKRNNRPVGKAARWLPCGVTGKGGRTGGGRCLNHPASCRPC